MTYVSLPLIFCDQTIYVLTLNQRNKTHQTHKHPKSKLNVKTLFSKQQLNLWRYGDVGSDDEDDGPRKKPTKQEKPKPKPGQENKNAGKKE